MPELVVAVHDWEPCPLQYSQMNDLIRQAGACDLPAGHEGPHWVESLGLSVWL